ncbi:MAG: DsbC family protein [Gammaproteobacteria bacterium]
MLNFKNIVFMILFLVSFNLLAGTDFAVNKTLASILPPDKEARVSDTPVPALKEVVVDASIFYLSQDGHYLFEGDLIDVRNGVNLTAQARKNVRSDMFASLSESDTITFHGVDGKKLKTKIYIYTDIDCGYCRKLHLEIPDLNKAGITVSYLAFPRNGLKGDSHSKAVSVWCSKDKKKALTLAKLGKAVESLTCDNPVADQYNLGQTMGLRGTPAVYSEDGGYLGAYSTAEAIVAQLAH